mgnify:CR=1 FL=1
MYLLVASHAAPPTRRALCASHDLRRRHRRRRRIHRGGGRRHRRMEVLVLGAGHDVGRSCVVVTLGDKRIMFDCGMHIGYKDSRRFPDFTKLTPHGGSLTSVIDAVVITHFHLDHCAAVPYLLAHTNFKGRIFMTHPTKAVYRTLLADFVRVSKGSSGEQLYTERDLDASMERIEVVNLHRWAAEAVLVPVKAQSPRALRRGPPA